MIRIGGQQDREHCEAPNAQKQTGHAGAVCIPEGRVAQEQGHDHFVADHRAERDDLDDDHCSRGRQPADEYGQRKERPVGRHRQRKPVQNRHRAPVRCQQARRRNGRHEQRDRHQVSRKKPRGDTQVRRLAVLDHRDVKLAWQAKKGEAGEQRHRHPARRQVRGIESARPPGIRGYVFRQHARAREQHEDHEQPERQEREELHQRFERDGQNHSLVALARMHVPHAEQDREQRQDQCRVERRVLPHRRGVPDNRWAGHACGQCIEAERHRLKLKRDVGNDADHRDDRGQRGNRLALAVARADEIRDGRDVVGLRGPHHLLHERVAQQHHQDRAGAEEHEVDAAPGHATHAAVEAPGRAVDGEGERIDQRLPDTASQARGVAVAQVCDGKKQREIADGGNRYEPEPVHRPPVADASSASVPNRLRRPGVGSARRPSVGWRFCGGRLASVRRRQVRGESRHVPHRVEQHRDLRGEQECAGVKGAGRALVPVQKRPGNPASNRRHVHGPRDGDADQRADENIRRVVHSEIHPRHQDHDERVGPEQYAQPATGEPRAGGQRGEQRGVIAWERAPFVEAAKPGPADREGVRELRQRERAHAEGQLVREHSRDKQREQAGEQRHHHLLAHTRFLRRIRHGARVAEP